MKDSAQLSLHVGEDVPGKLAELAGGSFSSGHFLTILIRVLHEMQQFSQRELQIAQSLVEMSHLYERQREQDETIRSLRSRLRRLVDEQAELLAVNHLLIDATPEFRNSSLKQNRTKRRSKQETISPI
jgi:hypothetical protein